DRVHRGPGPRGAAAQGIRQDRPSLFRRRPAVGPGALLKVLKNAFVHVGQDKFGHAALRSLPKARRYFTLLGSREPTPPHREAHRPKAIRPEAVQHITFRRWTDLPVLARRSIAPAAANGRRPR